MRRSSIVAITLALLLGATIASAPAEEPAPRPRRSALERARAAFDDGQLRKARRELQRARAEESGSVALARVELLAGLCSAAARDRDAALSHLRRAIELDPQLEVDPERYKPTFVALVAEARRSLQGELHLTASDPRARVTVDGTAAGKVPVTLRLMQGDHEVVVRIGPDGPLRHRETVQVIAGEQTRLSIALPAQGAASRPAARASQPKTSLAAPANASSGSRPGNAEARRGPRIWTWIAAGAAVTSAAVAVGLGLSAQADDEDACALLAGASGGQPCEQRHALLRGGDRDRYRELHDSAQDKSLASNVLWVAAGSFAAAAVISFFLEGRAAADSEASGRTISFRPLLGRAGCGVSAELGF